MQPYKLKDRIDHTAIAQLKNLQRAGIPIQVSMRVQAIVEDSQHFVIEDILWNTSIHSSYRHGPFETEHEADCFTEQRSAWLQNNVKPIAGTDKTAEAFVFCYPPPE